MPSVQRITIFVDDPGDSPSADYLWVEAWLARWGSNLRIADYSTGGYEHLWYVEANEEAVSEVPEHLLCESAWSNPHRFRT